MVVSSSDSTFCLTQSEEKMDNLSAVIGCSNNSSREGDENHYVFRTFIGHSGQQSVFNSLLQGKEKFQTRTRLSLVPCSLTESTTNTLIKSLVNPLHG